MSRFYLLTTIFTVFIFFIAGCSDPHDDDHMDIVGFEIRQENNAVIVTQARNPQTGEIEVTGQIDVLQGMITDLLTVVFIDPDGHDLVITDSDFSLGINPVNTPAITIYHDASQARWGFMVEGKQVGDETISISLYHGDHADFESRPVTIEVHSP
jgi:hypothetical protein